MNTFRPRMLSHPFTRSLKMATTAAATVAALTGGLLAFAVSPLAPTAYAQDTLAHTESPTLSEGSLAPSGNVPNLTFSEEVLDTGARIAPLRAPYNSMAILIGKTDDSYITCSGTLIDPEWILTAAHCFVDLGTGSPLPLQPEIAGIGGNKEELESVVLHSYIADIRQDIALVKLTEPAKSDYLRLQTNPAVPRRGQTIEIVGYGQGRRDSVIPMNFAYLRYNETLHSFGTADIADPTYMVQGDSGGPLLLNGRIIGVVSTGFGHEDPQTGVFLADQLAFPLLANNISWIGDTIGVDKLENNSYTPAPGPGPAPRPEPRPVPGPAPAPAPMPKSSSLS